MARKQTIAELSIAMSVRHRQLRRDLQIVKGQLKGFQGYASKWKQQIGGAFGVTSGYVFTRQLTQSLKLWGEYEAAMKTVQAKAKGTAKEMVNLNAVVRKNARETIFTAKQTADSAAYLAAAGLSIKEVQSLIRPVLDTAMATNSSVTRSADVLVQLYKAMGLAQEEMPAVADSLAAIVSRSNILNLEELGEATKYAAASAKGLNLEYKDMLVLLAGMHDAGIKGSLAGTSFRRILGKLSGIGSPLAAAVNHPDVNPRAQQEVLKRLNVSPRDSEGNIRNFLEVMKELITAGADASDMIQLFGAIAGSKMAALLGPGVGALERYETLLRNSRGEAARLSQMMRDNLAGDTKILAAAYQDLQLAFGQSDAGDFARDMVQALTRSMYSAEGAVSDLGNSFRDLASILAGLGTYLATSFILKRLTAIGKIAGPKGLNLLGKGKAWATGGAGASRASHMRYPDGKWGPISVPIGQTPKALMRKGLSIGGTGLKYGALGGAGYYGYNSLQGFAQGNNEFELAGMMALAEVLNSKVRESASRSYGLQDRLLHGAEYTSYGGMNRRKNFTGPGTPYWLKNYGVSRQSLGDQASVDYLVKHGGYSGETQKYLQELSAAIKENNTYLKAQKENRANIAQAQKLEAEKTRDHRADSKNRHSAGQPSR